MTAFGILQLVGASVLIVIAAIVFLVLFFRGLAWLDAWIKMRGLTDHQPREPRRRRRRVRLEPAEFGSSGTAVLSPARLRLVEQMAQAKLEELRAQNLSASITPSSSELGSHPTELLENHIPAACKRLATVHLISGEVISGVRILPKDESEREIAQLGFQSDLSADSVVFEDDAGRIYLVHSKNLKMLAWSRETDACAKEDCPGK